MGLFSLNNRSSQIITEKKKDDEETKLVPSSKDGDPIIPEDENNKSSKKKDTNDPIIPEDKEDPVLPEDSLDDNGDESSEDPVLPEEDDKKGEEDPVLPEDTGNEDDPILPEDGSEDGNTGGEPLDDESTNGELDDNSEDGSSEDGEEVSPQDQIKNLEGEIFANLDTEDLEIKNKELKGKYFELYDSTVSLVDRINSISRTEQNNDILNFAATKIMELRQLILDYTTSVYSRRSYMENAINFSQYLAVLSGINQLLQQITISENDPK